MTTNGHSVQITRAKSLQDITPNNSASDSVLAWSAPAGTAYSSQVWAPELHQIGASWYIYVAASDGNNANHHMQVLERDDPDPFGPFYYKAQLAATTDRWAIDGTEFEWQNIKYFVWSGWPGFTDGRPNLYIAEMRNLRAPSLGTRLSFTLPACLASVLSVCRATSISMASSMPPIMSCGARV
jgi:GH43 family beta-xylosidase